MFVKRSLGVAIVLFWCLMNVLLLRRQAWAPPPAVRLQPATPITQPMEEWWGVYFRGEKIGYAAQTIVPEPDGYFVRDFSVLQLNLLGSTRTVKTRLEMTAASDWGMKRFAFELESRDASFKARGTVAPGKLDLEVDSGGHRTQRTLPLSGTPYLPVGLKPYVATQNFEAGKEHLFWTFDPSTLSQQVTTVTVEGRERIQIGDELEPAIRIRQRLKGVSVVSWVDGQGRTLKEETPAGLALVRERPEQARALASDRSIALDVIAQTAVRLGTPIDHPEDKTVLKLKLAGFDPAHFALNGGRQRLDRDLLEIRREDLRRLSSYEIPNRESRFAAYLQPTPFLQSDHPEIRALVQKVLRHETDAVKATLHLKDWVYKGLAKAPTVSIPDALEVLRTRRGDCNEHTVLFNAMARAAGIPAKTVVGMVYLRGAFYYHAWSEVWLGAWVSVDPVLNQLPADVTHIKFLEGEIDRQIDILQLIGKLEVTLAAAF